MAKAHITTPEGIDMKLEGTPQELAAVLKDLKRSSQTRAVVKTEQNKAKRQCGRVTVGRLIDELKDEGFFKQPKALGDVKKRLGELGHHYPVTTLSGRMQEHVKKRNLRRFKEKGRYVYAQ